MKSLILVPLIAGALAKACAKTAANSAEAGAKNSDVFVNQSVRNSDAFTSAMSRATARSARYLEEDLNKADSNVYYENNVVVVDNTRNQ